MKPEKYSAPPPHRPKRSRSRHLAMLPATDELRPCTSRNAPLGADPARNSLPGANPESRGFFFYAALICISAALGYGVGVGIVWFAHNRAAHARVEAAR